MSQIHCFNIVFISELPLISMKLHTRLIHFFLPEWQLLLLNFFQILRINLQTLILLFLVDFLNLLLDVVPLLLEPLLPQHHIKVVIFDNLFSFLFLFKSLLHDWVQFVYLLLSFFLCILPHFNELLNRLLVKSFLMGGTTLSSLIEEWFLEGLSWIGIVMECSSAHYFDWRKRIIVSVVSGGLIFPLLS